MNKFNTSTWREKPPPRMRKHMLNEWDITAAKFLCSSWSIRAHTNLFNYNFPFSLKRALFHEGCRSWCCFIANKVNPLTSNVLAGLMVILPGDWDFFDLADWGGSAERILNGACTSNRMVSGVSVVFPKTNRCTKGVSPFSCWREAK